MTGSHWIIAGLWVLAGIEAGALIVYAINPRHRPHHHVLASVLWTSLTIVVLAGAAVQLESMVP